MKKKNIFLAIVVCLISVSVLFPTVANARNIGQIGTFRITARFAGTSYLQKVRTGSHYVLNLNSKNPQIRVKHYLANSNGASRSGTNLTWTGTRGTYANSAQAGYIYNVNMARENPWDGAFLIDGSWSPDT